MEQTFQTPTQNIFEHGQSVFSHTKKLIIGDFEGFRLPDWFIKNHHFIVNNLHDWETIKLYNLFHDAGKSACKVVDEDGKQHFPNHAEVSEQIFREYSPDNPKAAELIGLDMVLHTESTQKVLERNLDIKPAMTLLVTAFAEIHANAEMFGSTQSTGFKIKFKKLEKTGKKLIEKLQKHVDRHAYIFIRRDLSDAQKIVQSAHALFEQAKNQTGHPSLVVLSVDKEEDFKDVMIYLLDNNIQFKIFREPMEPYGNSITAIATESLDFERKQLLKDYPLLIL